MAEMDDSFCSVRMDNSPTPMEPKRAKISIPVKGLRPIKTAKAAPAKPISDKVWAKKLKLRATT